MAWPSSGYQLAADLLAAAWARLAEVRINRLEKGVSYAVVVMEGRPAASHRRTRARTSPNDVTGPTMSEAGTPDSRNACRAQLTGGRSRGLGLECLDRERGEAPGGRDPGGR
jgi:hypothetical protein